MGVDLRSIVKPIRIRLEDLSGRALAVDAFNTLYQFLAIIRGESGEYLRDREGRVTSHISGLFYRNVNLLSLGIKPIYVFDGQSPELKALEIERRKTIKEVATNMYNAAIEKQDFVAARRFAQATSVLREEMVKDAKTTLDLLGIPWFDAPSEGEATAAYLTTLGMVDSAASQDYDSLLFGAKSLVRNVTISGRRKAPNKPVYVNVEPEEVELCRVLSSLGITREELVEIAIILGTDFNPDGFHGVGPATALKYIKQYGSIEKIPQLKEKVKSLDLDAIRQIFLKPLVGKPEKIEWRPVSRQQLVEFLCEYHDFSKDRVEAALDRLQQSRKAESETLQKWFP
jgi:flap endonuclease-1